MRPGWEEQGASVHSSDLRPDTRAPYCVAGAVAAPGGLPSLRPEIGVEAGLLLGLRHCSRASASEVAVHGSRFPVPGKGKLFSSISAVHLLRANHRGQREPLAPVRRERSRERSVVMSWEATLWGSLCRCQALLGRLLKVFSRDLCLKMSVCVDARRVPRLSR